MDETSPSRRFPARLGTGVLVAALALASRPAKSYAPRPAPPRPDSAIGSSAPLAGPAEVTGDLRAMLRRSALPETLVAPRKEAAKEEPKDTSSSKKSHKKAWIIAGIVIGVAIIVAVASNGGGSGGGGY